MSGVLCYGEALIDFLQFNSQDQDGITINDYRQFPGGAPANAAVALAKLGGKSQFAGQVGDDQFGQFLIKSLAHYGVDTHFTLTHPTAPTPLAFVHLDAKGDRSFTFLRKDSADLLLNCQQVESTWFSDNSLLHLCSNTLTEALAAQTTQTVLSKAKAANLLVSFDVNLRANLWAQQEVNLELVNQVVVQADVVKFAREEFELLAQGSAEVYISACLDAGCKLLLITNGSEQIEYITPFQRGVITPPSVKAVDTTAGGDGFIGAVLYILSKVVRLDELIENQALLESAISFASCAGAIAVSQQGAFPALPSLAQVNQLFQSQYGVEPHSVFLEQIKRELL